MHRIHIAHRDIKPDNIFYLPQRKVWCFGDFGEAILYKDLEGVYEIRGTYHFLPAKLK